MEIDDQAIHILSKIHHLLDGLPTDIRDVLATHPCLVSPPSGGKENLRGADFGAILYDIDVLLESYLHEIAEGKGIEDLEGSSSWDSSLNGADVIHSAGRDESSTPTQQQQQQQLVAQTMSTTKESEPQSKEHKKHKTHKKHKELKKHKKHKKKRHKEEGLKVGANGHAEGEKSSGKKEHEIIVANATINNEKEKSADGKGKEEDKIPRRGIVGTASKQNKVIFLFCYLGGGGLQLR